MRVPPTSLPDVAPITPLHHISTGFHPGIAFVTPIGRYFALVRREEDWDYKGWILCELLKETTLFSRTW